MNSLMISLTWCWCQVFLVATVAIGLSRLTMRRNAAVSAAIAWSGVVATLMLTLFVPISISRWMPRLAAVQRNHFGALLSPPEAALSKAGVHSSPTDVEESSANKFINGLSLLQAFVRAPEQNESTVAKQPSLAPALLGALAVASGLSLFRLAVGAWAVHQVRRGSRPLDDQRVAEVLNDFGSYFATCSRPSVRETNALTSAAVVGWWRPAIVLPSSWRHWSAAELKAVLAHEWAHIVRRDLLSRLVAALTVALQCLQPLVYWLRRQLLLTQELAADELAAAAIGSRAEYLRALAQLALRQDRRPCASPTETLLPVFSGFLMRRIEMLRATDCSWRGGPRKAVQWSAIGLLIAIALGTTALRGLAEPPVSKDDDAPRVASASKIVPKPVAQPNDARTEDPTLFQHKPFDIASLAMGKRGAIVVRLGEILKQPRFADVVRKQNTTLVELLNTFFPEVERTTLSLEDIDWIAGDFLLSARFVPEKHAENPHEVMFGTGCVFVRWNKDVSDIFHSLRKLPDAAEKKHGEIEYVELPLVPAIGPGAKPCIAFLDGHTLVWGGGESVLTKRLDKRGAPAEAQPWHTAWNRVDGGLVTIVAAEPEFKNPSGATLDESARLTEELFAKAPMLALGADWHGETDGLLALKFQLPFATEVDANFMRGQIEHMFEMGLREVMEEAEKATDTKAKRDEEIRVAFLKQARTEIRKTADGCLLEIYIAGPLDVESLLKD